MSAEQQVVIANLRTIISELGDDFEINKSTKPQLRQLYKERFAEVDSITLSQCIQKIVEEQSSNTKSSSGKSSRRSSKSNDSDDDTPKKSSKSKRDDDSDEDTKKKSKKEKRNDDDDTPSKKGKKSKNSDDDDDRPKKESKKKQNDDEEDLTPKPTSISQLTKIMSQTKQNINKTHETRRTGAKTISCSANQLKGFNISVDGNRFNAQGDADDVDFTDENNIGDANEHLLALIDPDGELEFINKFLASQKQFDVLNAKYANGKGKQDIKFVKGIKGTKSKPAKDPRVTRLDDKKQVDIPKEECGDILEYHAMLQTLKSKCDDLDKNYLDFLQEPIIRTPYVISLDELNKIHHMIPERCVKELNISFDAGHSYTDKEISNLRAKIDNMAYSRLFMDLNNFVPNKIENTMKKIFADRQGITERMDAEDKQNCWMQAFANINAFTGVTRGKHEEKIIKAWRNVLSSKYAYHVIMNNVEGSSLFLKSFQKLFCETTSILLLSSCLYPISFVCTPFMLYWNEADKPDVMGITESNYNQTIKNFFVKCTENVVTDVNKNNWVYYLNSKNSQNEMIRLLDYAIKNLKESV